MKVAKNRDIKFKPRQLKKLDLALNESFSPDTMGELLSITYREILFNEDLTDFKDANLIERLVYTKNPLEAMICKQQEGFGEGPLQPRDI